MSQHLKMIPLRWTREFGLLEHRDHRGVCKNLIRSGRFTASGVLVRPEEISSVSKTTPVVLGNEKEKKQT